MSVKAWLRARLGLPPDDYAAVMAALRLDESPLREAYARVAHTTVAAMVERLAEPGDHDRLALPRFEDYRRAYLPLSKSSWRRYARLLWERRGDTVERAFRMNALDFAMIVTRARGGVIREVEFVLDEGENARGHVVRLV